MRGENIASVNERLNSARVGKAQEKANPLKLMVFLFFWFFVFIVERIFRALIAIVDSIGKCISHILISPFQKELRLRGKIHERFKKFGIYNEDTRFVFHLYKHLESILDRGNRFFYVRNNECKKAGLRNLIDIVDKNYKDEIHRRAKIDYEKATGKKQSIFKQGLAFIFFALAFVICFPFIVVSRALAGAEKALTFLPEKLVEAVFKKEKAAFYEIWDKIIIEAKPSSIVGSAHFKFVFEELKMIDDLAAIKTKKMSKNSVLDEDGIGCSADTELTSPVDEAELYDASKLEEAGKDDLVGKYLTQVEAFALSNDDVLRRFDVVIAVDNPHNRCSLEECTLSSQA